MADAAEAQVFAHGAKGERRVDAADFFVGFLETAMDEGELLTEVRVPVHDSFGFAKFRRRATDWATVGAVAARTGANCSLPPASLPARRLTAPSSSCMCTTSIQRPNL